MIEETHTPNLNSEEATESRKEFFRRILQLQDAYVDALHLISELEILDVKVDRKPMAQLDSLEELFNQVSQGNGKAVVLHLKKRHQQSEIPPYVKAHAILLHDILKEVKRIKKAGQKAIISPERTKKNMDRKFSQRIADIEKSYPKIDPEYLGILPYRPVGATTIDFLDTNPN